MKKNFIIYTLFLAIASFGSFCVQAQEQIKPSERSFKAEINKVKQIQATRNTSIAKMPQPAGNIPASSTDKQVTNEGGSNQSTNSTTTKEKTQQEVTTKPSAGPMKQPRKPIMPKGK